LQAKHCSINPSISIIAHNIIIIIIIFLSPASKQHYGTELTVAPTIAVTKNHKTLRTKHRIPENELCLSHCHLLEFQTHSTNTSKGARKTTQHSIRRRSKQASTTSLCRATSEGAFLWLGVQNFCGLV
jgi:hypothetical protein